MQARYLELVRRGNATLNSGAWEVLLELFDPQIVWETTGEFADSGLYRGHARVRQMIAEISDDLADVHFEVGDLQASEDHVVANVVWRGRGKRSGASVERRFVTVTSFRDDKVVRVRSFSDRQQALEAAGLRE